MSAMSDLSIIMDEAIEGIVIGAIHYADIKVPPSPLPDSVALILTPRAEVFAHRRKVEPLPVAVLISVTAERELLVVASNANGTGVHAKYPYGTLPIQEIRARIGFFLSESFKERKSNGQTPR